MDFAVPIDHRIKLKEGEKKYKYLNIARELKKLRNMKVTIIPLVIGAFSTVIKGSLKGPEDLEIRGLVETIQTTTLLRTARIETFKRLWKPSADADVKNCQGVNDNHNKLLHLRETPFNTNSFDNFTGFQVFPSSYDDLQLCDFK